MESDTSMIRCVVAKAFAAASCSCPTTRLTPRIKRRSGALAHHSEMSWNCDSGIATSHSSSGRMVTSPTLRTVAIASQSYHPCAPF